MTNIHTEIDVTFLEYENVIQQFQKLYHDSHLVTSGKSLYEMRDTMQEIVKLMKSLDVDY